MATEAEAREIKRRHPELLHLPGVCGVSVQKDSSGAYFIKLLLGTDDPVLIENLPRQVEGCPVEYQPNAGPFHKLAQG